MAEASPPTNAIALPNERALVNNSSVKAVGAPFDSCANTQMFMMSSDDLQVLEERHDLGVSLSVVFDDLAGLAGLGLGDVGDLLAGGIPSDRTDSEVGSGHRFNRLGLGRHDPLEAGITRLDDTGRDADNRRQRAGHFVVAILG